MFIFGTVGGWVPTLWGADTFGMASIFGGMIGGGFGIWLGFKMGKAING